MKSYQEENNNFLNDFLEFNEDYEHNELDESLNESDKFIK